MQMRVISKLQSESIEQSLLFIAPKNNRPSFIFAIYFIQSQLINELMKVLKLLHEKSNRKIVAT